MRRNARLAKVAIVCPRCGYTKSVAAIQTEHIMMCSKCGAAMREKED